MFCAFGHNSRMATSRYRVPAMSEQHVLEHVRVRLIDPDDAIGRDRYRALIEKHHYLNSQLFRGTCYKAQGWRLLGETKGHGRARQDYYTTHNRPKQLWVRELRPKACATLRAARLPADLQHVEDAVIPRADLTMVEIRRLLVLCRQVPDWRAKKGKDYSLQCLLSIMVRISRTSRNPSLSAPRACRRDGSSARWPWRRKAMKSRPPGPCSKSPVR
jgi:hypothetical protein